VLQLVIVRLDADTGEEVPGDVTCNEGVSGMLVAPNRRNIRREALFCYREDRVALFWLAHLVVHLRICATPHQS
jgi:hypothetical protein